MMMATSTGENLHYAVKSGSVDVFEAVLASVIRLAPEEVSEIDCIT